MTNSSVSLLGRGSDLKWRCICAAILAFALLTAPFQRAAAQDAPDPGILIVDMQRIQRDAAAAKNVREQSAELRKELEKAVTERARVISQEEAELAELRERLSSAEFRQRVRGFEEKVFANRDFAQRESAKLQAALADASGRLRDKIAPILAALMREREAQVMLDSSQVVLSAGALDITEEVISRLDKEVPTMTLTLEPAKE